MKHLIVLLLGILSMTQAREIQAVRTVLLQDNTQGPRYFPSYTQDGQGVLFTTSGYTGLWLYDLAGQRTVKLTESMGAGYNPVTTPDGDIIYRQDEYVNRLKYTSYIRMNPQANTESRITEPGRFVSTPVLTASHLHYIQNKDPRAIALANIQTRSTNASETVLLNDDLKLKLIRNGAVTILSPRGEGHYVWAELSPQRDRILFRKTGDGTYICDLDGKIVAELGHASAPKWSPDGRFVVYMKDFDDGVQYTASEIWISSADGNRSWMITDTPERIEMYPQWAPDGFHVVYHSEAGRIFETEIRIEE